jgi:hypothetical protein
LPYARPTLQQLITQVQQDITSAQIVSPTIGTVLQGLLNQAVLLDVANGNRRVSGGLGRAQGRLPDRCDLRDGQLHRGGGMHEWH